MYEYGFMWWNGAVADWCEKTRKLNFCYFSCFRFKTVGTFQNYMSFWVSCANYDMISFKTLFYGIYCIFVLQMRNIVHTFSTSMQIKKNIILMLIQQLVIYLGFFPLEYVSGGWEQVETCTRKLLPELGYNTTSNLFLMHHHY